MRFCVIKVWNKILGIDDKNPVNGDSPIHLKLMLYLGSERENFLTCANILAFYGIFTKQSKRFSYQVRLNYHLAMDNENRKKF